LEPTFSAPSLTANESKRNMSKTCNKPEKKQNKNKIKLQENNEPIGARAKSYLAFCFSSLADFLSLRLESLSFFFWG
jgi:hypothetical protein